MTPCVITQPQKHHRYKARVQWHKPPGRQPSPQEGEEIIVMAAWTMGEDDMFPGEIAFLPEQEPYHFWIPQRDLILVEELSL